MGGISPYSDREEVPVVLRKEVPKRWSPFDAALRHGRCGESRAAPDASTRRERLRVSLRAVRSRFPDLSRMLAA